VVAIYTVYLDTYFIENVLLDATVLILTTLVWDKRVKWKRILAASVTGALLACGFLLVQIRGGRSVGFCNLLQGYVVLKIAYRGSKASKLLRGALYFYTISFVYIKVYEKMRMELEELHGLVISAAVLVLLGVAVVYLRYCKRKDTEDVYCDVEILSGGKKIQVRALYDTGNILREPVSGKPVSIVEKALMEEAGGLEQNNDCTYIPFHSIGEENGVLMGIEVDGLKIWKRDECIERYCEMVALYDGQLSTDGRFRMILHQELL